jgi:hypothetical protein
LETLVKWRGIIKIDKDLRRGEWLKVIGGKRKLIKRIEMRKIGLMQIF